MDEGGVTVVQIKPHVKEKKETVDIPSLLHGVFICFCEDPPALLCF